MSYRFIPQYFESDIDSGIPVLTPEGKKALEEEFSEPGPHPLERIPVAA